MFLNNFMRQTCRQLFLQPTRKTGKFQQTFINSLGIIKDSFSWDSHIFPYQGLPFSHYHISLREPKPKNNNKKVTHKERPSLLIISLGPFPEIFMSSLCLFSYQWQQGPVPGLYGILQGDVPFWPLNARLTCTIRGASFGESSLWSAQGATFLKKFIYFIYLFLAVFGLRCCARAFSSCGEWGLLLVAVRGHYSSLRCTGFSLRWLLLLWSTGFRHVGFSNCGTRALERRLSGCGARA